MTEPAVPGIAHVIQTAVAPVFLLSGVGVTIGVLANRLARIVDRARALEARPHDPADSRTHADLRALGSRAKMVNRALTLCTICAILIALVIVALFVSPMLDVDLSGLIALIAITRAGIRAFWASPDRTVPRVRLIEMAPVVVLLLLCAVQTIQAGPVMRFMAATAQSLHNPHDYIRGVLGPAAKRSNASMGPT